MQSGFSIHLHKKKPITHTHAHASLTGQNNESQASMRTCVCLSWPTSFDYVKKKKKSLVPARNIYIYQRSVNHEAYFSLDTHFYISNNLNLHVNLASLDLAGITVLFKI